MRLLLVVGAISASSAFSQRVSVDDCKSCCRQHINEVNLVPKGINTERCELGCEEPDFQTEFLCQDEGAPVCQLGSVLKDTGIITFLDENDGQVRRFCSNGVLDVSFAPTVSPTPPTRSPSGSPTITITEPPKAGSDAEDNLPVVIGVAAAVLVIAILVMISLMPSRKDKQRKLREKAILSKNSGDHLILSAAEKQRMRKELENVRAKNRMSLKSVQDNNMLRPLFREVHFEIAFDFEAEQEDELSARRGEILEGVGQVNEDWWVVKRPATREVGMIPLNFMKELFSEDEESQRQKSALVEDVIF